MKTAIQPTRAENYAEWYQQVIKAADMAENSPVRGCMVIKPWGYALWENIQAYLDKRFKALGHKNYYFPLFIPASYLQREADHIEGFATECAVITHHRLTKDAETGKLKAASPLEEPLIVRPTSETIIGDMFSRWINSYRDLPLLMNQWANVVRWEMRPRIFLRTTEFLWQEGHTAHASAEEAVQETLTMLEVYREFVENVMAMPVLVGEKTSNERFPGAVNTYCIEAMMQDKKALQAGTSHFLGQNFSKAFNIKFQSEKGQEENAWTTSWGVSTRLIGGLIMTHSDDNGLRLPPKIAPLHVVIMPIVGKDADANALHAYCQQLAEQLQSVHYHFGPLKVEIDNRDMRGGEKAWSWVKKGVPLRIEVGKKELAESAVSVSLRTREYGEREVMKATDLVNKVVNILDDMQTEIFTKALKFRDENIQDITDKKALYEYFKGEKAGFARIAWHESMAEEDKLKADLNVTIRCIPLEKGKTQKCLFTGKDTDKVAILAKAY